MSLNYPESVIWYVKATSNDGDVSEGSAVAIRLQDVTVMEDGRRGGDPNTARSYLLTCAHVIRGKSFDGQDGCGPVVPESNIQAWTPDTGQTANQAKKVRIKTELRRIDTNEIPPENRANPVDDWVVLEICDPQSAMAAPAIGAAEWIAIDLAARVFSIVGYPGGAKSLDQGKVLPTRTGPFPFRDVHLGLLRLTGNATAAGMSGGGVFEHIEDTSAECSTTRYRLAGLHRARDYPTLQLHAISAKTVLDHINSDDVPFELVRMKAGVPESHRETDLDGRRILGRVTTVADSIWQTICRSCLEPRVVTAAILIALLAILVLYVALMPPNGVPRIKSREMADPGRLGAINPTELIALHEKYSTRVYVVLTEPIENTVQSPKFLLYSSEPDDQLELRGVIEEEASGNMGGRITIDPPGRSSETVRFEPEAASLHKGMRLRLLLGVQRGVAPADVDDRKYLESIVLERIQ